MAEDSKQVVPRKPAGAVAVPSGEGGRKRPVKKALEEEEFTEVLTTIIRRDFFPDIAKLEAQLEFIEASESNDYEKLRLISERFATQSHTPAPGAATPATFETPAANSGTTPLVGAGPKQRGGSQPAREDSDVDLPETKRRKPEESKGLDDFMSRYHSEDDASFGELMEKAKEAHRQRHAWLYEKEQESRTALEGPPERLAIADGGEKEERKAIEYRPAGVKTWTYTAKNSLMYIPEGVDESAKEKVENKLKERAILHANTRLSSEFLRKTQSALQKAAGGGEGVGKGMKDKIGVDGRVLAPAESPSVNGYGFVVTPQIQPGVDASPLMTWGSIEGTPFHLETDVTPGPGPSFKIPKVSRREELAMRLAEKANKANRERKKAAAHAASPAVLRQKLGATPTTSERIQLLSPAARKLVSRAATPGSIHRTDKALRASYTPTHTPVMTPQSTPQSHSGTTPRHKVAGGSTPSSTPSLTDNLLNLKNR